MKILHFHFFGRDNFRSLHPYKISLLPSMFFDKTPTIWVVASSPSLALASEKILKWILAERFWLRNVSWLLLTSGSEKMSLTKPTNDFAVCKGRYNGFRLCLYSIDLSTPVLVRPRRVSALSIILFFCASVNLSMLPAGFLPWKHLLSWAKKISSNHCM